MPLNNLLEIIITTLQLAAVSTLILMLVAAPLAWWLARRHSTAQAILETLITLPLVLPPTVIGFYLLIAFAPQQPLAKTWFAISGQSLAFSFSGLVIGSVIYSLPFVVQPMKAAFEKITQDTLDAAAVLGAKPIDQFLHVVLPSSKNALLAAAIIGFAHTLGEFGIVLMIGGNIAGETQVLSIALFEAVESSDYQTAHQIAAGLVLFSLLLLAGLFKTNRRPA